LAFDEECYKQEQHALKKYSNNRFEPQKEFCKVLDGPELVSKK
jgi:hypothetical protein